ncbi:MAG: 2-C-methyl-D-erythritol 2,4-cyclodiphosphate synthase [Erysipelotrichaceae bacterium]|nr:2-C-methyl-D-erythritol 2,4-cyclodiphosphate synthase [Erysipelotrichaceae bacterium]
MMRIGQSKDIHRLVEGRDLIIGGVKIPYEKGLLGHSDADVLLHAVIESLIGAMGLKDIGTHFSDRDPQYEGISSLVLLDKTYEMLRDNGYHVINIDSLIVIERPKMAPYIDLMRKNIAEHLHCDVSRINVKATCGEGMGFIGNGEGAMAEAVCLIEEDE